MEYVYKSPLEKGCKQVYISKKQHNEIFKLRIIKWHEKYEYYICDKYMEMHCSKTLFVKIILVLLYPFGLLLNGLANYKETNREWLDLLTPKKRGTFIVDCVYAKHEQYNRFKQQLNKE